MIFLIFLWNNEQFWDCHSFWKHKQIKKTWKIFVIPNIFHKQEETVNKFWNLELFSKMRTIFESSEHFEKTQTFFQHTNEFWRREHIFLEREHFLNYPKNWTGTIFQISKQNLEPQTTFEFPKHFWNLWHFFKAQTFSESWEFFLKQRTNLEARTIF